MLPIKHWTPQPPSDPRLDRRGYGTAELCKLEVAVNELEPELCDCIRIHTTEETNAELKRIHEQQLYDAWIKEAGDGKAIIEEDDGYCD